MNNHIILLRLDVSDCDIGTLLIAFLGKNLATSAVIRSNPGDFLREYL